MRPLRFAAVVSENEFIQVNLQLVLAHPVIGSNQPLLQVADRPVGKRDSGLSAFAQLRPEGLATGDMFKTGL